MSAKTNKMLRDFIDALTNQKGTTPYDTQAKVVRIENGTAWVHIAGGVDETPVKMTINSNVGDDVQVRVSGGRAWIVGNATAPPTDDTVALKARIESLEANEKARIAEKKASDAVEEANNARQTASGSLVTDTLHYLASSESSGVTTSTAGWTTTPQSISESKPYLWTYHTYTKADGTSSNSTPVITGTYGQKGEDGTSVTILGSYDTLAELQAAHPTGTLGDAYIVSGDLYIWNGTAWENVGQIQGPQGDSVTVSSIAYAYQLSTSGTTVPTGTWQTTPQAPTTTQYAWTRTTTTYSDGSTAVTYTVGGKTGTNGTNGTSPTVSSSVTQYQKSTSGTSVPTGSWSNSALAPDKDNYVWTKTTITYSDGTTAVAYAVAGKTGATGASISQVINYYLATPANTGITTSTSGWTTTVQTMTQTNQYLWNYQVIKDSNSNVITTTSPCIIGRYGQNGTNGTNGVSITGVEPQYNLSTSTSSATGTWGTSITYETGKYIWTREKISYSNSTTGYSTAIYNEALTQACSDALSALTLAQSVNQYSWHTETDTGAGAGTHITGIPQEDFLEAVADDETKGGFNVLINNIAMKIRNGLKTLASYGAYIILGNENGTRTEVHSDEISMITEDDVVAVSFKSSVQSSEEIVSKPLTNSVSKNTTSSVTLSDLATAVSGSEFSVTYNERYYYDGSTDGAFMSGTVSFKFTKDTSTQKTHTYTENATGTSVTRTVTFVYDGNNSFTITNPSPYFTLDLVNLRYTSQNAPTPETTLNGLVSIGGAEITQPTLDTTTLTPYSSRCSIIDGGILRVGKWRFIQVNIQIEDVSLSANNTWAVLDGLSNDLPVTDGRDTGNNLAKMTSLTASAQKNAGDISAYITGVGRIVVTTSDQPLVLNNVVMISGWYIAQ